MFEYGLPFGRFFCGKNMKEQKTLAETSIIQSDLFRPLTGFDQTSGNDGFNGRIRKMRDGQMPKAKTLFQVDRFTEASVAVQALLGDFAPKVLALTLPDNLESLIPEQLGIAGGWCALRSADTDLLNSGGKIANPETGEIEKITSVDQACAFLEASPSFDQIVEAIGAVRGKRMAAVSEVFLWGQQLTKKLELILRRSLSESEKGKLITSVEKAEATRAEMTQRYLRFVIGKEAPFLHRVRDEDILDGLKGARDRLLAAIDTEREARIFNYRDFGLKEIALLSDDTLERLQTRSLVWAMYSQPYLEVLRDKGDLKGVRNFFIAEPSLHAYGQTRADDFVVKKIYQDTGIYFDPKGINADTGFIAFMECLDPSGKSLRVNTPVGLVPNISNWESQFDAQGVGVLAGSLLPENNLALNPKENRLFVAGVNFLPLGRCQEALLELVRIQERFREEKEILNRRFVFTSDQTKASPAKRSFLQRINGEAKEPFLTEVRRQNEIVSKELRLFFEYLTLK